jgi:transcription elongation GreA/GreB family factor
VRCKYKFGDQNRIKIETPFATTVYQLKISGDQMTLQEPGGSKLEFTRISETPR